MLPQLKKRVGLRARCMGSNSASITRRIILGKLSNLPVFLCSHLENRNIIVYTT